MPTRTISPGPMRMLCVSCHHHRSQISRNLCALLSPIPRCYCDSSLRPRLQLTQTAVNFRQIARTHHRQAWERVQCNTAELAHACGRGLVRNLMPKLTSRGHVAKERDSILPALLYSLVPAHIAPQVEAIVDLVSLYLMPSCGGGCDEHERRQSHECP
eukprot:scaffold47223_cov31-Tisochrysis_lutea.AAC.3